VRRLTAADLESMTRYGFDKDNAVHRKAWIKRNDNL
jgi:hypothetical protein